MSIRFAALLVSVLSLLVVLSSVTLALSTTTMLPIIKKAEVLPTPVPTSTPVPIPQLSVINGDFEDGPAAWAEYSSNGFPLILSSAELQGLPPHSGNWAVWLGGAPNEASILSQQVSVPVTNPILYYWYWIDSEEICNVEYDIAGALLDGEAIDAFLLCDDDDTNGWVLRQVPVSAYAGRSVLLEIAAFTDNIFNSNLFIDDVSFGNPLHPGTQHEMNGGDTRSRGQHGSCSSKQPIELSESISQSRTGCKIPHSGQSDPSQQHLRHALEDVLQE